MILGIDTSCYTTSLAVIGKDGGLRADCRKLLEVEKGKRGMAQSEMFFSHINSFPNLLEQVYSAVKIQELKGLAVSTKPRPVAGSYMPVFRAGENMAQVIAASLGLPIFRTTHQEGHLAAAIWSLKQAGREAITGDFIAVHLSGGTSEILYVKPLTNGFKIEIILTADLAAGQFIDRIGTALGLPFPSGSYLEELADNFKNQKTSINLPVTVQAEMFYFSGGLSASQRLLLSENYDASELSKAVFNCIAATLVKAVEKAAVKTGLKQVLFCGGVIKNKYIRSSLQDGLSSRYELYFSDPGFSGDNSVGVALLGLNWISAL